MKRLWLFAVTALSLTLFTTSCEDEIVVPPVVDENFAPTLTLLAENPVGTTSVFSADATLELESAETIIFIAVEGSDSTPPMSTLSFSRNGESGTDFIQSITADDGTEIGVNNPALLVTPYDESFRFEIGLRTSADFGLNTFDVTLTDDGGLTSTVSLNITTVEAGTDITVNFTGGVIFNADGENLGAFDLDAQEAVSSSSDLSELQDDGIDLALPAASNWKRTIRAENGATLKVVDTAALGETYSFAGVETKEEIQAVWDSGVLVDGSTEQVNVDDQFVVETAAGDLYLILVTEVNNTNADNNDNYVIDIKN